MRNILKISNTTPMQLIQSGTFHYIEQVCDGSNGLRYGGAVSSYLSAKAFYVSGNTTEVSVGDVIYYYREYDVDKDFTAITPAVEELIGIFTVEQVEKGKHGYEFVAYDNIRKLDTDYSSEILSAKASFPMTHNAFLSAIQTFMSNLGVTVDFTGLDAFSDTTHTISYFYAQSLTVMDILRNYAALECSYLKCNPNGDVTFTQFTGDASYQTAYWYNTDRYIIAPSDQTTYTGYAYINGNRVLTNLIPIYYKQDGLSKEDYFIVPFKYWKVSNLDGSKMLQSQFFPTPGSPTPQGNYWLTSNFVFEYSSFGSFGGITKQSNFNNMLQNKIYPFEVHLFPFRCPFGAGCYIPYIEDTYGTRFASMVMKMDWSDFEVILSCENPQYYQDDIQKNADTDYREQSVTIEINRLQELITGLDNSKVSKSGDTMTGALTLNTPLAIASGGTGASSAADGSFNLQTKPWKSTSAINSTNPRTLSFSGSSGIVYFAFTGGNNANNMGAYIIYSGGASATPVIKNVSAASNLTLTAATGKITISSSSSANCYMYLVCMSANAYNNLTLS